MIYYKYGSPESKTVLLQMIGEHDRSEMRYETEQIGKAAGDGFCLIAVKVSSWNHDLSPWRAPAVFGKEAFGEGAKETLAELLRFTADTGKRYFLGGYSLAGLFALWAAYQTDAFEGIAAVSPSMWFPGFVDYMKENPIRTGKVYLSLGDREERTRNPVMSKVGACIREGYECLRQSGTDCVLEWNPGNHFKDPGGRIGRGFAWLLSDRN